MAELEVLIEARIGPLEKALSDAEGRLKRFEAAADRDTKSATAKMEANLGKTAAACRQIGSDLTRFVTLPVSLAIGAVGKLSMDFDRGLHNVDSIAKLTGQGLQDLKKDVLDLTMDRNIRQGPDELAKGLYDVVSANFKGKEALDVLREGAYGASAGLTDTATATKVLIAVLKSGIGGVTSAKQAMDTLFQEVNYGVNTFGDLASQLGDVLSTAKLGGVSLQEVTAAIAVMTLHGISAAESVTALNQLILHIVKPSDDAKKVMHGLGIEFGLAALQSKGLAGWLIQAEKATREHKQSLVDMMPEVRGLKGLLNLTNQAGKEYADMLANQKHAADGAGATFEALKRQNQGLTATWEMSVKELKVAAIQFGDVMAPTIRNLADDVHGLSKWLNTLNDDQRSTILKAGLVAAALGPTIIAFGKLASAVKILLETRAAMLAWGATAVAEETAVGAAAEVSATKVGWLKTALTTAAAGNWVIPVTVAFTATMAMKGLADDFMGGLADAKKADSKAYTQDKHSQLEKARYVIGQVWKEWVDQEKGNLEKARQDVLKVFGRGSFDGNSFDEGTINAVVQEIIANGTKSLRNSAYPPTKGIPALPSATGGKGQVSRWGDLSPEEIDKEKAAIRKSTEALYELNKAKAIGRDLTRVEKLDIEKAWGLLDKYTYATDRAAASVLDKADADKKAADALLAKKKQEEDLWKLQVKANTGTDPTEAQVTDYERIHGVTEAETAAYNLSKAALQRKADATQAAMAASKEAWQTELQGLDDTFKANLQDAVQKHTFWKEQRDWAKEHIEAMQRELAFTGLLTEADKMRYDLAQKKKGGWTLTPEEQQSLLDLAKGQDDQAQASADWKLELAGVDEKFKQILADAVKLHDLHGGQDERYQSAIDGLQQRQAELAGGATLAAYQTAQLAKEFANGSTNADELAFAMHHAKQVMAETFKIDKAEEWKQKIDQIAQGTADVFGNALDDLYQNGFQDFFKNVLAGFEKMLFDMAKSELLKELQNAIVHLIGGAGGGGGTDVAWDKAIPTGTYNGPAGRPSLVVPSSRGAGSQSGGGSAPMVVHVTVHAQDAGSFVKSKHQIASDVAREIQLAVKRR